MSIPRIKVNNFHTFYYQYEPTLLDSLEAQEIPAQYNCRGGYCGCCKVRLIDGEVEYVQDSLVDLNDDEILACCCVPKSHIEIEMPDEWTLKVTYIPHLTKQSLNCSAFFILSFCSHIAFVLSNPVHKSYAPVHNLIKSSLFIGAFTQNCAFQCLIYVRLLPLVHMLFLRPPL